jgi:uncharacterized membrane protein
MTDDQMNRARTLVLALENLKRAAWLKDAIRQYGEYGLTQDAVLRMMSIVDEDIAATKAKLEAEFAAL